MVWFLILKSVNNCLKIELECCFLRFLSFEWNSIRLGGPAHGIVTKTVHKTLPGGSGGLDMVRIMVESRGWWGSEGGGHLGIVRV